MAEHRVEPSTSERPATSVIHPGETAEAYIEGLVAHGVSCLFLNPGTDTFPVQEAVAKLQSLGKQTPRVVLCPFEITALAAAHGYYAATGRPQAVLVHVDVGTQNLGSMLHNAQRGRAAVVIFAGRAPYTTDREIRGARDSYIHWLQEQMDQHGIVRNYTKWDYELRRPDQVGEVLARAFQVAASDPPGPVYLTLPREVLMASPGSVRVYRPERFPPARLGAGDPDALREVAALLVRAERPVVLTSSSGRSREGFEGLVRLAELLALPVVEWRDRVNFPAAHPLYHGHAADAFLPTADVVLVLDHDVPYIPTRTTLSPAATVAQIDLDPVKERIPLWTFPVDIPVKADSGKALPLLAEYAAELLTEADRQRIERRRADLAARHARLREEWNRAALERAEARPISPEWLGYCLEQLRRSAPDLIFAMEAVTNALTMARQIQVEEPGTWFQSGGSGLGWAIGAALGIKLARPDRPVAAVVGDGSFLFGAPVATLWSALTSEAPILVVICNNACYNATKQPLVAAYPEGYSVRLDRFVGIDLGPTPRYDLLAASVGAYGERVEEPSEIVPALQRGLARVREGQSAVVDVILQHP